jgi:hypothetical protein
MKPAKILIIFTFLLAFALQVSAQDKTPKVVWGNLQEKYKRFEDVKPIIVNDSDKTIFMFADVGLGIVYNYLELFRFFEDTGNWTYVLHHEHSADKKYQEKIMSNLKLEPQHERPIIFDAEGWMFLTESDGMLRYGFRDNPDYKGKGKYKFKLQFYAGKKITKNIYNGIACI